MVVDLLDVGRDRGVVLRVNERLLDDARAAPRGECGVVFGEDRERNRGVCAKPSKRPASAAQAEQDAAIANAQRAETGMAYGPSSTVASGRSF
jgi:hypothetical protein